MVAGRFPLLKWSSGSPHCVRPNASKKKNPQKTKNIGTSGRAGSMSAWGMWDYGQPFVSAAPGAQEKAKAGARPATRQKRAELAEGCLAPQRLKRRVDRRVPPPSPGGGSWAYGIVCAPVCNLSACTGVRIL